MLIPQRDEPYDRRPLPHRQLKSAQHSPSLRERRLCALKRRNAPTIAGHFYTSLVNARQPAALWLHAAHNSHRAYDAALRRWLRRGPLSDRGPHRSQVSRPGLGAKRVTSACSLPREQDLRDQRMSERQRHTCEPHRPQPQDRCPSNCDGELPRAPNRELSP